MCYTATFNFMHFYIYAGKKRTSARLPAKILSEVSCIRFIVIKCSRIKIGLGDFPAENIS